MIHENLEPPGKTVKQGTQGGRRYESVSRSVLYGIGRSNSVSEPGSESVPGGAKPTAVGAALRLFFFFFFFILLVVLDLLFLVVFLVVFLVLF